ncbi:hypothetical protein BS47DRAFT_685847 [Hydnum rufescens UP504]|uniref:Uncharacterized protein n=1 Tax=Hydnum rufescens UP504 TaxID=1448309 RepID=A0A9P6DIJ8_9AGAM|nr:hypothetical protein BS47DRAFT_685847 [Hydnum rufescens UP504]
MTEEHHVYYMHISTVFLSAVLCQKFVVLPRFDLSDKLCGVRKRKKIPLLPKLVFYMIFSPFLSGLVAVIPCTLSIVLHDTNLPSLGPLFRVFQRLDHWHGVHQRVRFTIVLPNRSMQRT